MALTVGSHLGHYDVTALLGEGGMGQVWQATDTQLSRQVALKILPDAFAADPDHLARFQREAQVLASLAGALEAAHEQGVIHRDLKPANVKVKADGTVKVLDRTPKGDGGVYVAGASAWHTGRASDLASPPCRGPTYVTSGVTLMIARPDSVHVTYWKHTRGEMSEWLKEHAWKACVGVNLLPRVRIPLSPPF